MTLVLDASAVLDLLLRNDRGEQVRSGLTLRANEDMVTVAHLDAEVFSGLARTHRAGDIEAKEVTFLLRRLGDMVMARMPITAELLEAAWDMRDNIAARDALYVATARSLDAELVTTDDRLANAVPNLVASLDAPQAEDKDAPD